MKISRISESFLLTLLLAISARAQQIASKDLLHPSVVVDSPTQIQEKPEYPNGCARMGVGYADGVTLAEDKLPREIKMELVNISETKFAIGSEIVATTKLQNVGSQPIQIPWSTNFRTTQDGQDPNNRSWEVGLFQITLRSKENKYVGLMSTSQPLYSSNFVSGSSLTIKPGEWITAQISFRVTVEHPEYEHINEGPAELAVEWFQTVRTRVVKDCGVTLGYFPYDSFYQHTNRTIALKVEVERPDKTKNPSP